MNASAKYWYLFSALLLIFSQSILLHTGSISFQQQNRNPRVQLNVSPTEPEEGQAVTVTAKAEDPDGDPLTHRWWLDWILQGETGKEIKLTGLSAGEHEVRVEVSDGKGGKASEQVTFVLQSTAASACICTRVTLSNYRPAPGEELLITALVYNPGREPSDCSVELIISRGQNVIHSGQQQVQVPGGGEVPLSYQVTVQPEWQGSLHVRIGTCSAVAVEVPAAAADLKPSGAVPPTGQQKEVEQTVPPPAAVKGKIEKTVAPPKVETAKSEQAVPPLHFQEKVHTIKLPSSGLVSVVASLDGNCRSSLSRFTIGAEKTAAAFRFQLNSSWVPCSGSVTPEFIGFIINRLEGENRSQVFKCLQNYSLVRTEEGRPLKQLILKSGTYEVAVFGAKFTNLNLQYEIR